MSSTSISFAQLPLLTKGAPSPEETAYYEEYWRVMGQLFAVDFPQGEAYTIPELPLWVTKLAPVATAAGWEPRYVDFSAWTGPREGVDVDQLAETLADTGDRVVCVSPFTANYELALDLGRTLRSRRPEVVYCAGGAHVSALPHEALADGFDFVAVGRGEAPLDHLLRSLAGDQTKGWGEVDPLAGRPIAPFPGLGDRLAEPAAPIAEDRAAYEQHRWTPADYDIIPAGYPMHYARIYATLGCPYMCSFCADTLWIGMKPYRQEIGRLRLELERMRERFDPPALFVGDEVFTLEQRYCRQVIDVLGDLGIPWFCQTRANLLRRPDDRGLLQAMAANGCRLINIGAESGDPEVLKALRKRVTLDEVVGACQDAKEAGLGVLTYWMVGGPGETRRSAARTLDDMLGLFSEGLTDLVDYFICTPYPGTRIYDDPDRYEVVIDPKPWPLWREDIPSVMRTAELGADDIFDLWLTGLRAVTAAMAEGRRRRRAAVGSESDFEARRWASDVS